jgi:hypothetical protein
MQDIFGNTINAIKTIAPNLRFTISAAVNNTGDVINDVDWNSFKDESGALITNPSIQEIIQARDIILAGIPLKLLRQERNRRLIETDWWTLPDRTMTPEQIAYRQALRDITINYDSLENVVWPDKPL